VIECVLACGVNGIGLTVVNLVRCHQADPGMVMLLIVPIEEPAAEAFGILDAAEALREAGLILQVLKWLSENGLSLEVCGLLCERVTPRSASSNAVALAFIGPPRSACRVS
jgi:hypothetical protein